MAWTAPATVATGQLMTAAWFNTYVRDNFLEAAPAKATTAGGFFVATGANAIAERVAAASFQTNATGTMSTSYVGLDTSTPAVTVTTGTDAILWHAAEMDNSGDGNVNYAGVAVTGASSVSAADGSAIIYESSAALDAARIGGHITYGLGGLHANLAAGSNTFTQQYRVTAGNGTFDDRLIVVFPL